ncbi:MAG: hypothetical protein Q4A28_00005, partial [Brachymonas sp.]|nr:hypothetical protein [Brachymonas sp.]
AAPAVANDTSKAKSPKPSELAAAKQASSAKSQRARAAEAPAPHPNHNEFSHYIGSAADIDLNDPASSEKIFYHPENFLQGHVQHVLRLAAKNGTPMRLAGIGFKAIVIDPAHQCVVSAVPLRSLLSAGRIPLAYKNMQLSSISSQEALRLAQDFETYSTESILWQLALCASRGRLPANTSLDVPISLTHWPNLTRLQAPPHAARIFSLWVRQGGSLRQTVESLDVPQRYVFALYSACSAIGLIQFGKKQMRSAANALQPEPAVQVQKKQGMFRMLIGKLNGYFD